MRLEEATIRTKPVYHGKLLTVHYDDVQCANGVQGWREWVEHPGGVIVVPMLDDETVVMLRQFRYAPRRVMDELPAGLMDRPDEEPMAAARRELLEETGYRAERFTHLGHFYSQSGYSTDTCHIVLAQGLTEGPQSLEEDEVLEPFSVLLQDAITKALTDPTDARTLLALMLAQRKLAEGDS